MFTDGLPRLEEIMDVFCFLFSCVLALLVFVFGEKTGDLWEKNRIPTPDTRGNRSYPLTDSQIVLFMFFLRNGTWR